MMNSYTGGPLQQAMSGLTTLNNDWYDGNEYQIYAIEYKPGAKGEVVWFVGEEKTWKIDARAIGPNGNIGQRVVPEEPMTLIFNFGMSPSFAAGDEDQLQKLMPATMRVDYIRIYQDPKSKSLTCDPEGYETTEYIEKHKEPYTNVNLTSWYVQSCSSHKGRSLFVRTIANYVALYLIGTIPTSTGPGIRSWMAVMLRRSLKDPKAMT